MAEFFKWNSTYSVGVEKIDEQHKKLLEIINQVYDAFIAKKAKEKTAEIIEKLVDYTKYHFSFEEQMLIEIDYSKLDEHKEMHKIFVDKLNEYEEKINNGTIDITYDLMSFLRKWLIDHIQVEDKKYSKAVLEKQ